MILALLRGTCCALIVLLWYACQIAFKNKNASSGALRLLFPVRLR